LTWTLVLGILGFAAVDSLNPSTIVACAYILSTPRPLRRALAYAGGVFTTYLSIGTIMVFGFGHRANEIIDRLRSGTPRAILFVGIGALCIAVSIRHWRKRPRREKQALRGPRRGSLLGTFGLGATMTLIDAPTAFPYVGALGVIARTQASAPVEFVILVLYNVIFISPALVMISSWRLSGDAGISVIEGLRTRLSNLFADRRWAIPFAGVGLAFLIWPFT
jgi:cytochrome c biogenesis protein CcdA